METKETLDLGELNVSGIDRRQVEQFCIQEEKRKYPGLWMIISGNLKR